MESLENLKETLSHMRETIRRRFNESETESTQALSAYDNHPADLATDTFHRELDVGLSVGLNRRLHQIARAEEKLDEGSYGQCDRCGGPISGQRLKALPDAVYCISCQEDLDEPYEGPPSEVSVVPFPWGNQPDIHRDVVEPDGVDFWQSLAQWGNSDTPSDTPPAVTYSETFDGFWEPIGYVEDVESIVDEKGEVLFDALRQKEIEHGEGTSAESDQYPE